MTGGDLKRWRTGIVGMIRRALLSVVLSTVIVTVGTLALFVTGWPKWVSLTIEPLSLTLMPGVILSLLVTQSHDYPAPDVLRGAYACYLVIFYLMFSNRDRAERLRMRTRMERVQAARGSG